MQRRTCWMDLVKVDKEWKVSPVSLSITPRVSHILRTQPPASSGDNQPFGRLLDWEKHPRPRAADEGQPGSSGMDVGFSSTPVRDRFSGAKTVPALLVDARPAFATLQPREQTSQE
ncbi:hypothetical protein CMUS01_01643 [Colletotrichum musicola]|uniref:Uncharacterized protein n=1 Tax=Colletotrichum musicola TaxID=2175873 RepID=A0A8H6NWJ6_9PEZI|nr:hypothetical protein CMUS01_01643 [Colletotrichum musicola]